MKSLLKTVSKKSIYTFIAQYTSTGAISRSFIPIFFVIVKAAKII